MSSKLTRGAACGFLLLAGMSLKADVSITAVGSEMTIGVPASHAGDRVLLLWDDADRGTATNAWAHVREVVASVSAEGGCYTVDLSAWGVSAGQVCRVTTFSALDYLDVLGTFSSTAYVDTGVKDTDCHGVAFGFYATEKTTDWGYFIGSNESTGFVVGNNSGNFNSWNWAYRNGKKQPRPSVYTDRINEAVFGSGKFVLNGADVNTSLGAGAVGTSGNAIRIGQTTDSRRQYGWWSHVSFTSSDGSKIIDYVPVQFPGTGRVAFYDRVSDKYVYSSGGGEFTAGTVTNTVETLNSSQLYQPRDLATIAVSVADTKLTAQVPANYVGDRLVLVWDDADKGRQPSAWAHSAVLAEAVAADGGAVVADLSRLDIRQGQVLSVFALHQFEMLDQAKVSAASYVDTGVKDTDGYRATFGFYAEASDYADTTWGFFMGTYDGDSNDRTGFVMGLVSGNPEVWYWKGCGYRSGVRPTVSKTTINEATISQEGFSVNGTTVTAPLNAATFGTRRSNVYLGTTSEDGRHQAGWWSHLEIGGVDGRNLIEYVPVRRADGKVGFYDRISNTFVGPTGTGDMVAGTVTNASVSIVHRRSDVVRPRLPQPFELTPNGSQLTVKASSALAGECVRLAWDGHTYDFAGLVPAEGDTYTVDLATLEGGVSESGYTVQGVQKMELLDKIKLPDSASYINTGAKDTDCHAVYFGFLGTQKTEAFGNFIGTEEAHGFTVGANNAADDSWYWAFYDGKKGERPTVSTTEINEAAFADGVFTLNGSVVNSSLHKGVVGTSGRNMYVGGCANYLWRFWFGWWSYVRFDDAGGNALIDYIPAKRQADGRVGFFDRATRTFVFSSSTGTFEAGTTTNANASAVHLQRSFTLSGLIATAVWTGGGDATRYDDPANWTCTNFAGDPVAGVPGPETTVSLPAELAGDCNLAGLSSGKIVLSGTTDLKGHALTLPVDADFPQAATVTDTVGGGELRFEVVAGVTATNSTVGASGLVKIVKTGAGKLVMSKIGQAATGGLLVTEGTFACGGSGSAGVYGDPANTITVVSGATFDCNGYKGHSAAKLVLDGGTVANSVLVSGAAGLDWFADVTLTADSFVRADRVLVFSNADGAPAFLEMNGHTLTLDIDGNYSFRLVNVTVTGGGEIHQRTGGFLQLGETGSAGVTAETTTLRVDRSLSAYGTDSVFLNYVSTYGGYWDKGVNVVCVKGRFTPGTRWHSARLLDGAVLDLSDATLPWTAACNGSNFDCEQTLSFAENATITVDTGNQTVKLDDWITSWKSKPAGASSATFVWADSSIELPLTARAKGLFVGQAPGLVIQVR